MLTLTEAELFALTHYKRRADQLRELHRQGFHRARIGRDGSLILERAHYDAVASGRGEPAAPRVRLLAGHA